MEREAEFGGNNMNEVENSSKAPDFITNRLDVKFHTIVAFQAAINKIKESNAETLSIGPETQVHIITNFGTVTGEIVMDHLVKEVINVLETVVVDSRNEELSRMETADSIIVNNTATLFIRNAVLRPFTDPRHTIEYPSFHIFVDQIVGFSWGQ